MTLASWIAEGRPLVRGKAAGEALVLDEPLSFWGGVNVASGRIVDARHPQAGLRVTGRVLVMRAGRGSSSSSSVLAECLERRTGPAAILLGEPDVILVLGALVATELGASTCPIVVLGPAHARINTGDRIEIGAQGTTRVTRANAGVMPPR